MLTILIMDTYLPTYLPYLLKYRDILNGYLSSTVTMKKPEQVRGLTSLRSAGGYNYRSTWTMSHIDRT
ncbi:hypothetical protein [Paenibacillus tundrae]